MEKKDFVQLCIEALNRDRERNGLPPVQIEKVFVGWETKPFGRAAFLLTPEGELVHYAQYRGGPVVRLTRSIHLWSYSPVHGEALTLDDLIPVEHGHDLDNLDLGTLPTASRKGGQ